MRRHPGNDVAWKYVFSLNYNWYAIPEPLQPIAQAFASALQQPPAENAETAATKPTKSSGSGV